VADRDLTIRVNLQGADAAARGMDQLSASTSRATRSVDDLNRRDPFAATRHGTADPDYRISDAAYNRVRTGPGGPPGGGGGGPPGGWPPVNAGGGLGGYGELRRSLYGSGLSRVIMPLYLAHAAGQVAQGFGRGLEDISQAPTLSAGEAIGMLNRRLAESLPIIGGFVKGIESIGDALSGVTARRAGIADFLAGSGRQMEFAGFAATHGRQTGEAVFQATRRRNDALGAANLSQAFLDSLTPDVLAAFRQRGPAGELESGVNAAEFARRQAAAAVTQAEAVARAREADVDAARAGLGQTEARAAELRADQLRAVRGAQFLHRAAADTPGAGFPGFGLTPPGRLQAGLEIAGQEETARGAVLAEQLAENRKQAAAEQERIGKRLEESEKAQADAARARLDLKRAEIDVDRARLQIDEQRTGRARQGTITGGFRSPLENQADLELFRTAIGNPRALTPEQMQHLRGLPQFAEATDVIGGNLGRQDVALQQGIREANAFLGRPADDLAGMERANDRLAGEINKRIVASNAERAKQLADVFDKSLDQIVESLAKLLDAKLAAKANEIDHKRLAEQAQAK
jgi:hypothetical protein